VSQHHDTDYDGIAIFACRPEGLRTVIRSRIPFPLQFHLAPRPRIRPLTHLYDEYEAALFVEVGQKDASIYLVRAGEIEEHHRSEIDIPEPGRTGMFSEARRQRHTEDHVHRHLKSTAEQLMRLADREEIRNIILSGTETHIAAFRRQLPRGYDENVVAVVSLDRNPSRDQVVTATLAALQDAERERERRVIRQVLDLRGQDGRVAVGLEPVLRALEQGRVHRLLVSERFEARGFRCTACGKLGEQPPESCELCGEPIVSTDLAEAMVVAAIQRGSEVDEIVGHDEFEEYGGVAALLRY
jgi:peptide subunit release factor 1 (eRF1)